MKKIIILILIIAIVMLVLSVANIITNKYIISISYLILAVVFFISLKDGLEKTIDWYELNKKF